MFKLEFDPNNKELAGAIGRALTEYSGASRCVQTVTETVGDVSRTVSLPDIEARTAGKKPELAAPYGGGDGDVTPDQLGKFAETAAGQDGSTDSTASSATADSPVDEHGTPHDPKYCVGIKAAKPFYTSGSNKGQWKKKPGVGESDYNEWYAATMPVKEEDDTPVNTAAAFGAKQDSRPAPSDGPKTSGELMAFISEQQAAGNLTQADVTNAYNSTGVQINDLFDPSKEKDAVTKLYQALANKNA